MNVAPPDEAVSAIAAAIGEPARARMLYSLVDGHARTATELAALAGVTPSTASVHLQRLKARGLVKLQAQGKHRYYSLDGPQVASALEALCVLAGGSPGGFEPNTPHHLRAARTCYDHIAGALGVALHDRFLERRWLVSGESGYNLTASGRQSFEDMGIDIGAAEGMRRRFAFPCLDWSERRPHLGGALAAGVLTFARKRRWVAEDPDGRALSVTRTGERELQSLFGLNGAGIENLVRVKAGRR
jgi:DNA-binding transcriptional ArsR family regulator